MAESWSQALILLFKGPLSLRDQPERWRELLEYRAAIDAYLSVLGLSLYLDEADGYAFIRQRRGEAESELPRLVRRQSYSYWETVLAVILRQRLLELDSSGAQTRLVLEHESLLGELQLYWPHQSNEAKLREQCELAIRNFEEKYRFLRRLPGGELEVERILRAVFDADQLQALERKLKQLQTDGQDEVKDDEATSYPFEGQFEGQDDLLPKPEAS